MLSSKIQNKNQSQAKIDDLLQVISQARQSLQQWQDKRTEAMISLDALSYDIVIIEDEKNRTRELNEQLREEIKKQGAIYQAHVEAITEQMQLLRLEKEEAEKSTNAHIQAANETLAIQQQMEADFTRRSIDMKNEYEARFSSLEQHYQAQISQLNSQIDQLVLNKRHADQKEVQMERELQAIRAQILSVFQIAGAEKVLNTGNGPAKVEAAVNASTSGSGKLKPTEIQPTYGPEYATVQDYLKRFGY